jgi:hypothetical protein
MRWTGHVALMGKEEYKHGFGKKEPLGRPNIGGSTIFRWIGWNGMEWIYVAQDRHQWRALVNTVMNLRVL